MKTEPLITPPTQRELDDITANEKRFELLGWLAIGLLAVSMTYVVLGGFSKSGFGPLLALHLGFFAMALIGTRMGGAKDVDDFHECARLDDSQIVALHNIAIETPAVASYVAKVNLLGRDLVGLDWATVVRIESKAKAELARRALSAGNAPHSVA